MNWRVRKNWAAKCKSKQMQNRKLFPSSSFWLKAFEANGISNAGASAFFATSTVREENTFVEQLAVLSDEDQRECPLCMETFDDYFSNETNDWMYRGTVYMNEAKASTRRLYKSLVGRIVHAKCRIHKHLLLYLVMFAVEDCCRILIPTPTRMDICVPNNMLSTLHSRLYALFITNICNE